MQRARRRVFFLNVDDDLNAINLQEHTQNKCQFGVSIASLLPPHSHHDVQRHYHQEKIARVHLLETPKKMARYLQELHQHP